MQKTLPQLFNKVYEIVEGKDLRKLESVLLREYPKSKGKLSNLNAKQLEAIIPEIQKEYDSAIQPNKDASL
ncbi:hypothetical protein phi1422_0005 [Bdellovibrio phage phi1422]|uniref:hypothetical protein n=1 Tax=Bdellovibrio phage phi1422 TaxID=1127515 RepID=UPI0002536D04|nr:hypothetical protein F395_gp05 [Bdellovibrio phage phi1422]AFC22525.1 hypothetical protein phi1422_0005 [Bdellovibrio phage phi1422]